VQKITLFILLALTSLLTQAQKVNHKYRILAKRIEQPIVIDGLHHDQSWEAAQTAEDFFVVLPMDSSYAKAKTKVKFCFDYKNLYVLAICHKPSQYANRVESLRRDFNFQRNDNFIIFIDPFEDRTNGQAFGVNAAGAQWDGSMSEGNKVDLNWDNKWISEVKDYGSYYIFEAAIPFTTLRYKTGIKEWGINLSRNDISLPEKSAWAPVPRQFPTSTLAFSGILVFEEDPPSPGANISVIPYMLSGMNKNYQKKTPTKLNAELGGDIKIGVTSSLNLDLTYNPDFSQVEVDRQVTNLDRFELFFPERRQFFLENGDLFANFGFTSIRPFFSRRIGLESPIVAGARLSGKLNKDWRIGALNMQTQENLERSLPSQNFSVLSLQRKVFSRSNIGFIAINKETPINFTDTIPGKRINRYNRNIGIEYNLASANNKWTGKLSTFKSFTPKVSTKDWAHAGTIQYTSKRLNFGWQHEYVGENYNAEVGYVPRKDYFKINPSAGILFFPKSGLVLSHSIKAVSVSYFNTRGNSLDNVHYMVYTATSRKNASITSFIAYDYVKLTQPFDPTNSGKDTIGRGTTHMWNAYGLEFNSPPQKLFTFNASTRFGGYYQGGTRTNFSGEISYRLQPIAIFSVGMSYNDIRMPAPWNRTQLWLISPRIDLTMTNTLYFTTFVQYNNQQKNVNINTRLQWRYKPASDIFLVYTDNYLSLPFAVKNRAVVLKFTYWWNP
jgi:Domain of unknown function (DUF5916)/Carbohydrate family 9 binding domain-like